MSVSTDPRIGTELLGYRIESLLGRGGMSVVYRAEDLRLNRNVALKLLAPELAEDERFRERFLGESRLAASIDHPNIVPIYEAGEIGGQLYIAMRYVEGTDLKKLLRTDGALEPKHALALLAQLADALDAAHRSGLVHRDVKPSNALLDESDHAYLGDFGLTKSASDRSALTAAGRILGTVDYAAPEQIEGESVDGRADVYSLGCVLYECLTGEVPFPRESELAVLWAHVQAPPPRPSERRPELLSGIDAVISKALAKTPEDRYGSCSELIRAASDALVGRPAPEKARRYRRRELLVGAGAAIAASSALAAVLLTRGGGGGGEGRTTNSLIGIDPDSGRVRAFDAGPDPSSVAVGGNAVWVANSSSGTVTRLDPSTGATRAASTDGPPAHLAVSGRTLIVVYGPYPHGVDAVDTATLHLRGGTSLAGAGFAESGLVAAGKEGVWLVNPNDNAARKLDLGQAVSIGPPITLYTPDELGKGGSYNGIAVGAGAVWVTGDVLNPLLFRIDPQSQRPSRIELPFAPNRIAADATALWITDQLRNRVWRFDPRTKIATSVAVGPGAQGVAVGAGAVWVANAISGTVSKIDPRRRKVVREFRVGDNFGEVAVGDGGVWASQSSQS